MSSLLVIGAGSFSPEVEELPSLLGYKNIAFLDDNPVSDYCYSNKTTASKKAGK